VDPSGPQAHRLKGLTRRLQAVTAEPAGELLQAMTHEKTPNDDAQRCQTKLHRNLPEIVCRFQ
jgi:hypothetical protein